MADGSARVVFIAGPTASGKSAAALALAEAVGGEIVNADAIQVYADLQVLSARPRPDQLARAPHHLFGFLDGATRCSAGRWSRRAAQVIGEITARGRPAIVVGGTGLYFRALGDGLSPIPEVPDPVRAAVRGRFERLGPAAFRAELIARDPEAARLGTADSQRLLRAFEVLEATGRPLAEFQAIAPTPLIAAPMARVVIELERETLYRACDARFDRMMTQGALDEAQALFHRELSPDLPVMKALGAAELLAYLRGHATLDEAADLARRNTRRFAKRQLTWFRHQAADWTRAADSAAAVRFLTRWFG